MPMTQKMTMQLMASMLLVALVVDGSPQAAIAAQDLSVNQSVVQEDTLTPAADAAPKRVYMRVPMTAYSSTPDQTDDTPFITASGTHVRDGILAANFLPIGTRVKIPSHFGDKIFVVEDRMNARYNIRADIWMESRDAAKMWGIKYVTLEVYPK